jgi:hypothetical protein
VAKRLQELTLVPAQLLLLLLGLWLGLSQML